MPTAAMTITMDKSNGITFIARIYDSVQHIGNGTPTDCWELHALKVDDETMDYLSDNQLTAAMIRRHNSKEVDRDTHLRPLDSKDIL